MITELIANLNDVKFLSLSKNPFVQWSPMKIMLCIESVLQYIVAIFSTVCAIVLGCNAPKVSAGSDSTVDDDAIVVERDIVAAKAHLDDFIFISKGRQKSKI